VTVSSSICNPPVHPSLLPSTRQRLFPSLFQTTTIRLRMASRRTIPRLIPTSDQLYTKYLYVLFLNILVASVHLTVVIRQDRFWASCLYPSRPATCPSTQLRPSTLVLPFFLRAYRGSFFESAPAGGQLIIMFIVIHYASCNSVARYFLLLYESIHPSQALETQY